MEDWDALRSELLQMMRELAYKEGEVTLASGKTSDFYVNSKPVMLHPRGLYLLGRCLLHEIELLESAHNVKFGGVGGLTLGADPISAATSMYSAENGRMIPAFIVRKEAKAHGTEAYVEGLSNLKPGSSLVVLEDVVTTGGSSLKAVQRLRGGGFQVDWVISIVDRQEGGAAKLQSEGLNLCALFTRSDFQA